MCVCWHKKARFAMQSPVSSLCNFFVKSSRALKTLSYNGVKTKLICVDGRVRLYHKKHLFITPDDVQDGERLTTHNLFNMISGKVGRLQEYSPKSVSDTLAEHKSLMDLLPRSVDELPPRRMKDSFLVAVIPLKDKLDIRERYVTFDGSVRVGRVLEDVDYFGVYCAYRHILNPRQGDKNPYVIVTALVDSIRISKVKMRTDEDVRLTGHVTYAGRSSIEVTLVLDQKQDGVYVKIFHAIVFSVARDPLNSGSALVNPLVGETDEEKKFLQKGIERQAKRKAKDKDSLEKTPPTEEERNVIHDIFLQQIESLPSVGYERSSACSTSNKVKLDDTALKTVFLCHPQYRNRYNKIFGGFIMRQACELAFANTCIYAKQRPRLVQIDDIIFRLPVDIGSILRYTSHVGYVEGNYVHCPVRAEVINPSGECQLTNVFQFTYWVENSAITVPQLTFDTYREAMVFLESRRHFKKMMGPNGYQ